jgi:hypothetical protein
VVGAGFAVAAGADPAEGFQPGVGAFDWPAVAGVGVGGFQPPVFAAPDFADGDARGDRLAGSAGLADPGVDPQLGQGVFVFAGGVAAVGPELARVEAGYEQPFEQGQQVALLVLFAGAEQDVERQSVRFDG